MKSSKTSCMFLIIFYLSTFLACKDKIETQRRTVIHYNNGQIFCIGNQIYSPSQKDTINIGTWQFYYPDGKLNSYKEFDADGELIHHNVYSETGVLTKSYSRFDNKETITEFYDSGKIKRETFRETINDGRDDEDNEYNNKSEFIKEYYSNGLLKEERHFFNEGLEGNFKRWDLLGNLVLDINYHNGMVQK